MKRKLFEIKENEVEENNNLKEIKNKRNYEIMKDILNPQVKEISSFFLSLLI